MLAAGVPDKYSMKRMGHATNNMLKTVYQHTIKEKEKQYDSVSNFA
jgi:integrase